MRLRNAILVTLLALAPAALMPPPEAAAQTPAASGPAETRLTLSETATVTAHPDELAGVLRAEATAPTPAAAQRAVNAAMADALAQAKPVAGVTASTGGYDVYREAAAPGTAGARPERWRASQTLALHGEDGVALLQLVGALQQKGLAVSELRWRLSDAAERKAQAAATRQAIGALRARVDEAAGLLGLRFLRFRTVRLDSPQPVRPMMRMMAAAPAAAPLPPSAVAEDMPVSATVEAEAVLGAK